MDYTINYNISPFDFKIRFGDTIKGNKWTITAYLLNTPVAYSANIMNNSPPSMTMTQFANIAVACVKNGMFKIIFKESDRNTLYLNIYYGEICNKKIVHVIELINDKPELLKWLELDKLNSVKMQLDELQLRYDALSKTVDELNKRLAKLTDK
jgi:hypothetical protein